MTDDEILAVTRKYFWLTPKIYPSQQLFIDYARAVLAAAEFDRNWACQKLPHDVETCPRGKLQQPEPTCTNRAQCWEPCGLLGNDERYVKVGREPNLADALGGPKQDNQGGRVVDG